MTIEGLFNSVRGPMASGIRTTLSIARLVAARRRAADLSGIKYVVGLAISFTLLTLSILMAADLLTRYVAAIPSVSHTRTDTSDLFVPPTPTIEGPLPLLGGVPPAAQAEVRELPGAGQERVVQQTVAPALFESMLAIEVHDGPSVESATIGVLDPGEPVRIVGSTGEWAQIVNRSGRVGWVDKGYLLPRR